MASSAAARWAIGLSVHTGWAACVVAGGTLASPRFGANERLELFADPERFVFHRAATLELAAARKWIARATGDVEARARAAFDDLARRFPGIVGCAIVAKKGAMPEPLEDVLAAHPRLHTAEGCLYRDALVAGAGAHELMVRVVPPKELDVRAAAAELAAGGRVAGKPWTKDQKLAALAAWALLAKKK